MSNFLLRLIEQKRKEREEQHANYLNLLEAVQKDEVMGNQVSAPEFAKKYAERSNNHLELLLSTRSVRSCGCESSECPGWMMVNRADFEEDWTFYLLGEGPDPTKER